MPSICSKEVHLLLLKHPVKEIVKIFNALIDPHVAVFDLVVIRHVPVLEIYVELTARL